MSVENSESSASAYHTQERKKSNLAFAFFCMEKDRAKDMEVLYAFCRLMDDIADDEGPAPEAKRATLDEWKREISSIYEGSDKLSPLGREMKDIIERRRIPEEYLQAIIDGVMRDTFDDEYETFEDVRKYCYGVASAVGLASIYVFGFKNPRTKEFAESLGYALQFTNILRDVVDDARTLKRSYVPSRELEAFGVRKEDLADPSKNPNCKKLFAFMYFRAKHFFNKSRRLLPAEDKRSLAPALIMWAIYEKILESLKGLDFEIPAKPFKISKFGKIRLALDAIKRSKVPDAENKTYGRALVLGGGIAGMQTAVRLCSEGFDVELVEARANMGGRASALEWRGARLDNGTHALMGCYDNFFGFLKSMSVDPGEYFARTSCMDFIFNGGKKVKVGFPEKNANMLEQIFLILRYCKLYGFGSFKNLWLLAKLKMGMAPSMQGESAGEYLRRMKIPEAAVRNFWDPFCVSALNTTLDKADDGNARQMHPKGRRLRHTIPSAQGHCRLFLSHCQNIYRGLRRKGCGKRNREGNFRRERKGCGNIDEQAGAHRMRPSVFGGQPRRRKADSAGRAQMQNSPRGYIRKRHPKHLLHDDEKGIGRRIRVPYRIAASLAFRPYAEDRKQRGKNIPLRRDGERKFARQHQKRGRSAYQGRA